MPSLEKFQSANVWQSSKRSSSNSGSAFFHLSWGCVGCCCSSQQGLPSAGLQQTECEHGLQNPRWDLDLWRISQTEQINAFCLLRPCCIWRITSTMSISSQLLSSVMTATSLCIAKHQCWCYVNLQVVQLPPSDLASHHEDAKQSTPSKMLQRWTATQKLVSHW